LVALGANGFSCIPAEAAALQVEAVGCTETVGAAGVCGAVCGCVDVGACDEVVGGASDDGGAAPRPTSGSPM
jgi:hypothetical protein